MFAPKRLTAFQKEDKCQPVYMELVPSTKHRARMGCESEELRYRQVPVKWGTRTRNWTMVEIWAEVIMT